MNIDATLQHVSQLISDSIYRLKPIIIKLAVLNHKPSKQIELSDLAMLDIMNILPTCDGLQLKNQRENKSIDEPNNSQPEQSNIDVIWLGEEATIKTRDIDILYTLKSLIVDLQTQLEQLSTAAPKNLASSTVTLYRGARIRSNELEQLKVNVGSFISLNTFTSTSRERDIALTYAEAYSSTDNDSDVYPIIYEINCSVGIHSAVFADVEQYGTNLNEKEVLFGFSTVFEITSVESKDDIWTVNLCNTNKHTQLVDHYLDVAKHEMKESSSELLFGRLLLYLGEYKRAGTYVKEIAPILLGEDKYESLARFCFDIGRRYYLNGEIDFALNTYYSTLKYSTNHTLVVCTLYTIANVYFERNDYERALNYYEKILESEKSLYDCDSLPSAVYTAIELIAQNCDRQLDYHDEMRRMHSANGVTPLAAAHAREERQCIEVKLGDLSQRLPYAQKCKLEHQVAEEKCARIERNLERQMKDLIRRREALQLQEEDILEGSFSVRSTN
ncbi:unnamed protein product [Rotaria sordida]|uniref:ADP ribosyltransferase domain-containing protein n=1 Tax=Rotaria sordida TaxID=392033 RepID=A0A818RCW8_9BILA|nr:unnamed protein product [Rotaria sordida]